MTLLRRRFLRLAAGGRDVADRITSCRGGDLSVAADHHRRAVPGRRTDRYAWAHSRRPDDAGRSANPSSSKT